MEEKIQKQQNEWSKPKEYEVSPQDVPYEEWMKPFQLVVQVQNSANASFLQQPGIDCIDMVKLTMNQMILYRRLNFIPKYNLRECHSDLTIENNMSKSGKSDKKQKLEKQPPKEDSSDLLWV